MTTDPLPTLTAWFDEPTIIDPEGRPALVCWWTTGPNEPKRRAGVVWPDGAWEVYLPTADPCGGRPVECGTCANQRNGRNVARGALHRLCKRMHTNAARNTNSKSGGPL